MKLLNQNLRIKAMEKGSLKRINLVWWRFFWRYALIFILINLVAGIIINYFGYFFPQKLYILMLFYGIFANVAATFVAMLYCLDHKFKKSPLILQVSRAEHRYSYKIWVWFQYFWRFILFAFIIGCLFGALFPLLLNAIGVEPVSVLKYSKYLGNIAVLPASYLAFLFLTWRKESKRVLLAVERE